MEYQGQDYTRHFIISFNQLRLVVLLLLEPVEKSFVDHVKHNLNFVGKTKVLVLELAPLLLAHLPSGAAVIPVVGYLI